MKNMIRLFGAFGVSLVTLASTVAFAHGYEHHRHHRSDEVRPRGRIVCVLRGGHETLCSPTWIENR